ncbi:hypothetical protein [Stieleria varia]|uniref:Uncharacterized protein n=1 Tax=Stieleria varia TaxID=2528005 RepID=A0A5C6BA29_9BACT|nr:hypothetical protein [Stieleria varia]TWU08291.1 hypothetical protein Pla52n_08730 [Stieleria varia]
MNDSDSTKKLTTITWLLAGNLVVLTAGAGGLLFGLLPKMERAIQATERVETRFQSFADEVQPVLSASADKAIDAIKGMDSQRLSETATEKTDQLMDAATERAKRFFERDK